ncbi:MAG: uracil phosphoribosyltransferase [bacterium]
MEGLTVVSHPLIEHKLAHLRSKYTKPKDFREILEEIATLMCFVATEDIGLRTIEIETPLERMQAKVIAEPIVLVPILRAGLGMVGGVARFLPMAKICHLGIYRDEETLEPVEYYSKFPEDLSDSRVIIIDPMLATGGSAVAAVGVVKGHGARTERVKVVSIIAAPEGVRTLVEKHRGIQIYTAALDRELNSRAYILPGLGDAGDRQFGTF